MGHNHIALVTGANRGIGFETARGLARGGFTVVMLCRDREAGVRAATMLNRAVNRKACEVLDADLSSLESVGRAAARFSDRFSHLDVLINNAATMSYRRRQTTDGHELQFGVNYLAHVALTRGLMDRLRAAPAARIVNVSSDAHRGATMDFDNLQLETGYSAMRAYGRSKLANILYTRELSRRLADTRITTNALHPGVIATGLLANFFRLPKPLHPVLRPFFGSAAKGARTSVYVGTSPEVSTTTGKYFKDCAIRAPSAAAQDDDAAGRLWEITQRLLH